MNNEIPGIKYLLNGAAVIVRGTLGNKKLVSQIYETDDGDVVSDDVSLVEKVYDEAPREKIDREVLMARNDLAALRVEASTLRGEILESQKGRKIIIEKLSQHEALKRIEDFLDGKITHFVKWQYGEGIINATDIKADSSCDRGFKLLTLFGRPGQGLTWQLNRYSDGSGGNEEVFPACSLEEAKEILQKKLYELKPGYWGAEAIALAKKYGLNLPDGYLEDYKKRKHNALKKNLLSKENETNGARAALEAFEKEQL